MSEKKEVETPAVDNVVVSDIEESGEGPGVAPLDSGAIGSTTVKHKPRPAKVEKPEVVAAEENKVAVLSNGNIHWDEVGSLKTGYNLVTEEAATKWTTLGGVRLATPEEVAKEFKN